MRPTTFTRGNSQNIITTTNFFIHPCGTNYPAFLYFDMQNILFSFAGETIAQLRAQYQTLLSPATTEVCTETDWIASSSDKAEFTQATSLFFHQFLQYSY